MGKPYPVELRGRVVLYVLSGHSHRSAAKLFSVSPRFVNRMVILYKQHDTVVPPAQGRPIRGHFPDYEVFIKQQITSQGDITLYGLCEFVEKRFGKRVSQSGMWYALRSWRLSYKKNTSSKRAKAG